MTVLVHIHSRNEMMLKVFIYCARRLGGITSSKRRDVGEVIVIRKHVPEWFKSSNPMITLKSSTVHLDHCATCSPKTAQPHARTQ